LTPRFAAVVEAIGRSLIPQDANRSATA